MKELAKTGEVHAVFCPLYLKMTKMLFPVNERRTGGRERRKEGGMEGGRGGSEGIPGRRLYACSSGVCPPEARLESGETDARHRGAAIMQQQQRRQQQQQRQRQH